MKNKILILTLFAWVSMQAIISDSRFIPWYQQTPIHDYASSFFNGSFFFITGDSAYANESLKHRGIPELYGMFDQIQLGLAAQAVGALNPLNQVWRIGREIEWNVHGKIQGQGFAFSYQQNLGDYITVGINTNFLHLTSHQKFVLPAKTISDMGISSSQQLELDQQRRQLLQNLGLSDVHWSYNGFSDTFLFVRLGNWAEYKHKCRYLSVGTTLGVIAPTSKQRDIKYASSLPFGGEGFTGITWGLDVQAELKQDWWVGVSLDLVHRFGKTQLRRLPVKGEPEIFGATTGNVYIEPGITVAFSPFVRFNDVRDGFDFQLQYVYQFHAHDVWADKRKDTTIPVKFTQVVKTSHWDSEYVLFKLQYDGHTRESILPAVTFAWDIPIKIIKPEESVKAQKVSLGFEYNF